MISKELLSEVLGKTIGDFTLFNNNAIKYQYWVECKDHIGIDISGYDMEYINIYELAHRCKEWALKKHKLSIHSGSERFQSSWLEAIIFETRGYELWRVFSETALTEPEAIFKACEWILKEISDVRH